MIYESQLVDIEVRCEQALLARSWDPAAYADTYRLTAEVRRLQNILGSVKSDIGLWQCRCGYLSAQGHVCYHCGRDFADCYENE